MIDHERYLAKVQKLMREENYAEARRILVLLDHPTAHLLLARLDEIQVGREKAKSSTVRQGWSRRFKVLISLMVMCLMVNSFLVFVYWSQSDHQWGRYTASELTATQITNENSTAFSVLLYTETPRAMTATALAHDATVVWSNHLTSVVKTATSLLPLFDTLTPSAPP